MDSPHLTELHRALVQSWNIVPLDAGVITWDDLLDTLSKRLAFLIRHDFNRLVTAMYLLDVSENRFNHAMSHPREAAQAEALAQVVLEREAQKMETRRRFRREGSIDVTFYEPSPDSDE
jgi:hypothetical protein